ncbi:MAG: bifunctional DNA primase/polymerase [Acidimicrobiia bacterium]
MERQLHVTPGPAYGRALHAVLRYAASGWAVFPLHAMVSWPCSCRRACPHPAKRPITRHGLHDARPTSAAIRSWWDRWPFANLGVATGTRSGIVVPDVDPPGWSHRQYVI